MTVLSLLLLFSCGSRTGLSRRHGASPSEDAGRPAADSGPPDAGVGADGGAFDGGCAPPDADGDGFESAACGGTDCDDQSPAIHPGACERGPAWETELIATDVHAEPPTVAVDAAGAAQTAWRQVGGGVDHAVRTPGGWEIDTIDEAGASDAAIAIDPVGPVHVAYVTGADRLVWAHDEGLGWQIEEVADANRARGPGIAIDSAGSPEIVYVGSHEVMRAHVRGGDWGVDTITVAVGFSGSIESVVVGANGAVHALFEWNLLQYATDGGGAWTVDLPFEGGYAGTLSIDEVGDVRAAYVAEAGYRSELRFAHSDAGTWTVEPAIDLAYSRRPAIAVDGTDTIHVVYDTDGDEEGPLTLRHAGAPAGGTEPRSWCIEEIGPGGGGGAIAVDREGRIHVVYVHAGGDGADLRYATRPPGPFLDGVDQDCDGEDGT